jgi:hypothetical protein
LAVSKGQPVTHERLIVNARDLADIPQPVMAHVFDQARKELDYLPQVPELRRLAGARREQADAQEQDAAWMWVLEYLHKHGVEGRTYREFAARTVECPNCHNTGWRYVDAEQRKVTRCECRVPVAETPAPKFPPRIGYALRQMALSVRDALCRIQECPPQYQGKLREDFDAAYQRAITGEQFGVLLEAAGPKQELGSELRGLLNATRWPEKAERGA